MENDVDIMNQVVGAFPIPSEPTQLDRIEAKLDELLEGKHALEAMAAELQGKGPLAMLSMFK